MRDLLQCLGAAHIADRIPGPLAQHIIGHRYKRIFFPEHAAVLANKTKPVHIRVYGDPQIGL